MGFSCGLVGLPNAGKSTILNALANVGARVESYPFCTITTNVGTVPVPDPRLDRLAALFPEKEKVPTRLEFVDIAGLVERASEGEGMGNQFLAEIRSVDAICHVVRCFRDADVAHVAGSLDPRRDAEIVETELLLKDYETLRRVADRLHQEAKAADRRAAARAGACDDLLEKVAQGMPVRSVQVDPVLEDVLRDAAPLTAKPCLYVANVGDDGENEWVPLIAEFAQAQSSEVVSIRGRLEAEIAEVAATPEERAIFLAEYGLSHTGLSSLVEAGYRLLGLVTFFTIDGPEVRAWTVPEKTKAPQAGARIHSDFADRFVLAEVATVDDLLDAGSEKALRDEGKVRRAGHDYVVAEGDVIHFICA